MGQYCQECQTVPLTDCQRTELDACLEEYWAEPEGGELFWAQVKTDIIGSQ